MKHRLSYDYLMGMTKDTLISMIRVAEHNEDAAKATLEQQAENVKDWAPVRHGRWSGHLRKVKDLTVCDGFVCSECGNVSGNTTPFCPHCGATMEGLKELDYYKGFGDKHETD